MTRLDSISDKVMDLVGHVGDSIRDGMPTRAGTLLQTGAALGMAKTGTRAAGYFVRRHPHGWWPRWSAPARLVWVIVTARTGRRPDDRRTGTQGRVAPHAASRHRARSARPAPRRRVGRISGRCTGRGGAGTASATNCLRSSRTNEHPRHRGLRSAVRHPRRQRSGAQATAPAPWTPHRWWRRRY